MLPYMPVRRKGHERERASTKEKINFVQQNNFKRCLSFGFALLVHIALISQYFQLIKIKFKAPNDFWSISKALIFLIALF